MTTAQIASIVLCLIGFAVVAIFAYWTQNYNLDRIKSKAVGDGQHGTARWATEQEIKSTYAHVPFDSRTWRRNAACSSENAVCDDFDANEGNDTINDNKRKLRPLSQNVKNKPLPQGTVVGCKCSNGKVTALVDCGDVHTLLIGAAGVGKTASFLIPNIEYACAAGMSFLCTDSKGDLYRQTGAVAKTYGYNIAVIDLRNPTRSDGFNLLYLVNRYTDEYILDGNLASKAKAEKYAKVIAKTVINSSAADRGQNSFFYDAAEGLLTAAILIVAEYCGPEKRHIISVFKLIQDLIEQSNGGKNQFRQLVEMLPSTHKARWFAGAALNTSDQAMASVLSTTMSRLNAFLDSELEQVLCFDTAIDAELFCNEKSAIYLVLPEEDATKHFMISLIVEQMYREILVVADECGGKLPNRAMFFMDEFGTIPPIQGAEMMFSASRSRRISIVAIIQSLAQLEKNYGREGAEIIQDNTQLTIFGGFAPNSKTADVLSKNLGERTIMSGSVSMGRDRSQSLQMIARPLLTTDELKALPKFTFVVMKTGTYPMSTKLPLFFKWGIKLSEDYILDNRTEREIAYADKNEIISTLIELYTSDTTQPENSNVKQFANTAQKLREKSAAQAREVV